MELYLLTVVLAIRYFSIAVNSDGIINKSRTWSVKINYDRTKIYVEDFDDPGLSFNPITKQLYIESDNDLEFLMITMMHVMLLSIYMLP